MLVAGMFAGHAPNNSVTIDDGFRTLGARRRRVRATMEGVADGVRRHRTRWIIAAGVGALMVITGTAWSFRPGPASETAGVPPAATTSPSASPVAPPVAPESLRPTVVPTTRPTRVPARTVESAAPPPTSRPTPAAARSRPVPSGTVQPDVLKRRDPLPAGVYEQIRFFFGGDFLCEEEPDGPPRVYLHDEPVVPTRFLMCFFRFAHDRPLEVTITPPAGEARVVTLPAVVEEAPAYLYTFPRLPGDPLGAYRVSARQGEVAATAIFTLARPDKPRIWLEEVLRERKLGEDVHYYFSGFPPRKAISFNLYGGTDMTYRTSVPAWADANGEGHLVLHTRPDDPAGCYGLHHPALGDPEFLSLDGFCVS